VADAGNHRIQVIGPDGQFAREFPVADWKMGIEPEIEADEDGTLYVTNPPKNVLLELDPSGTVRKTRATDGAGAPFSRPTGIALDRKERLLYVINSGNNTVSKISLKGAQ
jgi:DNA-binding beta-propeller fold protein YncE